MAVLGTKEAAERLHVSVRRVQEMIKQKIIPAKKVGRDWVIEQADLQRVAAMHRRPGRPSRNDGF